MMRQFFRKSGHWLWIFIMTDAVFLFVAWLINPDAFIYLVPFFLLFSLIALVTGAVFDRRKGRKDEKILSDFLNWPDEKAEELCGYFGGSRIVRTAAEEYLRALHLVHETGSRMIGYQEFIEAWVHEVKTPISLMELMLENHREEMTPYVYQRVHYAVHQLTEDTERILYYSRLNAEHPDFRIEPFCLSLLIREKTEEFEPFIRGRGIRLNLELEPAVIVSDRRVVSFLFSQLMSNAVKYTDEETGIIRISVKQNEDQVLLDVCNNGRNVPPEDRPFLFDKGFTGSHPDRQKATGMGLYLVKKYAEKLGITVQLDDEIPFDSGFGLRLQFHL